MKTTKLFLAVAFFAIQNGFSQNWTSVGSGISGINGYVKALIVFNGELYAGGIFDTAGGIPAKNIAKWNGSNWSSIGGTNNPVSYVPAVSCFAIHNSELYMGGSFTLVSGQSIKGVARWDGSNWQPVGTGLTSGNVSSLTSYNGELWACGYFSVPPSTFQNYVARWNGSNWIPFDNGMDMNAVALNIFSNELYVGGNFNNPIKKIAKWNGSNWSGGGNSSQAVDAFESDALNNILYAGGQFDSIEGIPASRVAKWNGTNWSVLGLGVGGTSFPYINALKEDQSGNLYIGGSFLQAGGLSAKNVAKWNGSSWSAVDVGINSDVMCLAIYNGELYAGGVFDTAGTVHASFIAKSSLLSSVSKSNSNYKSLKVYPNPAVSNQPIIFEIGHCEGDCSLHIYDCLGNEVKTEQKRDGDKIVIQNLSFGMHFLQFGDRSGKFVVQ